MSRLTVASFVLVLLGILSSPFAAHAQTQPGHWLEFTIDVSAASFDCSVSGVAPGKPGELYMDTDNLFTNDRRVPLSRGVMAALRNCPSKNLGRIAVTPQEGETNEQAVTRVVTNLMSRHLIECYTPLVLHTLLLLL